MTLSLSSINLTVIPSGALAGEATRRNRVTWCLPVPLLLFLRCRLLHRRLLGGGFLRGMRLRYFRFCLHHFFHFRSFHHLWLSFLLRKVRRFEALSIESNFGNPHR